MTRINCGIPVQQLSDEHLKAEHREIKRVPNKIRKRLDEGKEINFNGQPVKFKLGTGHEKFFYDKLGYLLERYKQIYHECLYRGWNMTDFSEAWNGIPPEYMGEYKPNLDDVQIIMVRINERIKDGHEKGRTYKWTKRERPSWVNTIQT